MRRPGTRASCCFSLLLIACAPGCGADDAARPGEGPADEPSPAGGDPAVTENFPGDLAVTAPARAAFLEQTSDGVIEVTGTGATAALHVDGVPVEASADGTFKASVVAKPGLNLIRVVDGERAVDTPVLYGHYASPADAVPAAVAFRINQLGIHNPDTDKVSLTLLATHALADVDIFAALVGMTFSGSTAGTDWTFHVEDASYSGTVVELSPRDGGAKFSASMEDMLIGGTLSLDTYVGDPSGYVTMSADAARVRGEIDVWIDSPEVAAAVWEPSLVTTLQDFQYESGDAGFFCCVDEIMTTYLRSKVEEAAQEKVQQVLAADFGFALSQISLPAQVDLAAAGLPAVVDVQEAFDGVSFDPDGGQVTASVRFHHPFGDEDPGAAAPGWLTVGQAPGTMALDTPFGVSISVDALNQALFAAWAQAGLTRTFEDVPTVGHLRVEPRLPPVVLPDADGVLVASAGEVVVDAEISGHPVQAAITIVGSLAMGVDAKMRVVVLTPDPQPKISITWLNAEGLTDSVRSIVEDTVKQKLPALLTPITLPLPSIPLGAIASSFGSAVGSLAPGAQVDVDAPLGRAAIYGDLAIYP